MLPLHIRVNCKTIYHLLLEQHFDTIDMEPGLHTQNLPRDSQPNYLSCQEVDNSWYIQKRKMHACRIGIIQQLESNKYIFTLFLYINTPSVQHYLQLLLGCGARIRRSKIISKYYICIYFNVFKCDIFKYIMNILNI